MAMEAGRHPMTVKRFLDGFKVNSTTRSMLVGVMKRMGYGDDVPPVGTKTRGGDADS